MFRKFNNQLFKFVFPGRKRDEMSYLSEVKALKYNTQGGEKR